MTLLCLVFAPVLPELNRADRVARQVKIIEEMGGECVFADRPQSFFAGLMQRWWPVTIAHIDHDLLMAEFNERTVDLSKLRGLPDVRGVCFNECLLVVPEDEPDVRLPRIEYVQLQERTVFKGGSPDLVVLSRLPTFFPNLRKAQWMGVPQRQAFVDALADCKRLEDLDLWFRTGEDESVNTQPLRKLSELRRLRLSGVTGPWNWEFLAAMESLEVVELGSEQQRLTSNAVSQRRQPGQILSPSQALAQATQLRSLSLYEWGDWEPQLEVIAQNNDLQELRLPDGWPAAKALDAVQGEPRLRKITNVWIGGDGYDAFAALKRFPELRELEVHFTELTDHDLEALAELKSLENICLDFDPHRGGISEEGLQIFRQLPIRELGYTHLNERRPLAAGMQRLVDSWPGPHPGMPWRQTDEGVRFLQGK